MSVCDLEKVHVQGTSLTTDEEAEATQQPSLALSFEECQAIRWSVDNLPCADCIFDWNQAVRSQSLCAARC